MQRMELFAWMAGNGIAHLSGLWVAVAVAAVLVLPMLYMLAPGPISYR